VRTCRITFLAGWARIPLALACGCAIAALGCARRSDGAAPNIRTVTVGATGDIDYGMNPDYDLAMKFLVFLPLVTEREDGALEGRLARSWEHSPDWREWTFHLRTDVRWEDGFPVTARDVKFTLAILASPGWGTISPSAVEVVTVDNDSTLRVRFRQLHVIRGVTQDIVLPEHLLGGLNRNDIDSWAFWLRPVGDGPYRLLRRVPKTLVEFEANPSYYGPKPRIERVIVRSVGGLRFADLLGGNIDVFYAPTPTQLLRLAQDHRFGLYHESGSGLYGIEWNVNLPFFRDWRVRRALTLAIDRQEARQVLVLPADIPVVDGPYTPSQLQRGDLPVPLPYDTAQARALLEAAGWFDTDGDGVLDRDGQPFRFVAAMPPGSRPGASQTLAVYVQAQLRRMGIRMEIQPVQTSGPPSGHFDAIVTGSVGWKRWTTIFSNSSGNGYHNPRVTELLGLLTSTVDPGEEDRIYAELSRIFQAEVPATFFFSQVPEVAVNQRIHGLSSPWRADPLRYMSELWLEGGH
jgi:peptide/nickel transport system substrate-binding protein